MLVQMIALAAPCLVMVHAILLESSTTDDMGPFELGTDGSGFDQLIVKHSGLEMLEKSQIHAMVKRDTSLPYISSEPCACCAVEYQ